MQAGRLAHDEARDPRPLGFPVLVVHAVIPDHRVGHRDELARIRRIGQDFLITGHTGVEYDLADGQVGGPDGEAVEAASVFQEQVGVGFHAGSFSRSLKEGSTPDPGCARVPRERHGPEP